MDTAEPVSYEFPAFAHRRTMDSPLYPYYAHPSTAPAPYSLPYQASSSAPYPYASLNHPSHAYQYFVGQPHLGSPMRLTAEQPLQSLPEIRPAKNAINHVVKTESGPTAQVPGSRAASVGSLEKKSASETEFSTEVDVLMKAIQAKASASSSSSSSPVQQALPSLQQLAPPGYPSYAMSSPRFLMTNEGQLSRSGKKRKYTCTLPDCGKSFAQKTHLDIHTRAHTGDKPFICKEPSCGQRFSQLGNLKTHQRRHTGEKPFSCDLCHKRFAQRGNVRAHKITHFQTKPFTCLLDECGKKFTQLGNLKSHQNKFHAATLRTLTMRFSQIGDNEPVNPQDRELWEYFATLYKNSNKGIKGRGKDRRISTTKRSAEDESMHRMPSLESDEDVHSRRGSYEDGLSMYTGGSSSDGDDSGHYYMGRRGS